jgi:hypothetical protein
MAVALAHARDLAAAAKQPLVAPEAAANGNYEEGWTEIDGQRARVVINRGGSTIARWFNQPPDDVLGDSERAAIRYCQKLWARLDYHAPPISALRHPDTRARSPAPIRPKNHTQAMMLLADRLWRGRG